ncbi:MAG: molybdopterin molybdotransferase MoeA [Sphingobacteriia bacterium]|nr:molybdopterin molybdotransferase MoeA [Sphingobacteriia bacterium]
MAKLILPDNALATVLSTVHTPTDCLVSIIDAPGKVLQEDIICDIPVPPFDKAAVDGYACRRVDLQHKLLLNEVIAAGAVPTKPILEGTCSKVMTGAMMPPQSDMIFRVEEAGIDDQGLVQFIGQYSKDNICYQGEDVAKGELVLKRGAVISPADIGILASSGRLSVRVAKEIRCGVISTGSELVSPDATPVGSQIRNSNGFQIIAQVIDAGAKPVNYGMVPDITEDIEQVIQQSLTENEVTILSGGVAAGDFDFIPSLLVKAGVEILFQGVAIQPGKPMLFGVTKNGRVVFGLPGNPLAAFVQFELLVRTWIRKSYGSDNSLELMAYSLGFDYSRKKSEREKWELGYLTSDGLVNRVNYNGSSHHFALAVSNVLYKVPAGVSLLDKGARVDCIKIR